jgi:exocyst complex component 4
MMKGTVLRIGYMNRNGILINSCSSFVFDGLPDLIAYMVISNAAHIKRLNHNGVRKMVRNILALQQNLLSVLSASQCAPMERGREYYSLFGLGPEVSMGKIYGSLNVKLALIAFCTFQQRLMQEIQDRGPRFTFNEYKVMLTLICDENRNDNEADDSKVAIDEEIMVSNTPSSRHNYNEWFIKLMELMADEE